MTWLVTGGAGYIGAHVVEAMRTSGHDVVVLDDLSSGDARRVSETPLVVGSILDPDVLRRTLRDHDIRGVVHLAAKKSVDESVRLPLLYFHQNVEGLRVLLEEVTAAGVRSFIFSSSAAVYGAPDVDLVTEDTDCRPVNPYGRTKLIAEELLADVAAATGLRSVNLRYFNVAGSARPELADRGADNLVPRVFERLSRQQPPQIFGGEHPTPDGTCIRDFVHVADVADAHVAAADGLQQGRVTALTANIGRGEGVSVREMIDVILEVTGTRQEAWSQPVVLPSRPGDPPRVVASAARIADELGWRARWGIEDMVRSAWEGWTAKNDLPVPA